MTVARRSELILVLIALAVLGSGVWVYIVERAPEAAVTADGVSTIQDTHTILVI